MSTKVTTKQGLSIFVIFAVLASAIFLSGILSQNGQTGEEFEAVTIETSGEIIALNFNDLNEDSETILIGTVKEILPSKWNTADGKRPAKLIADLGPDDTIYTDIVISVDEYLKNPLDQKEVIVRIGGGKDEFTIVDVDYEPSFERGEKVLLYLSEDISPMTKNIGPNHYAVTGFYQGKFTLTNDGMAERFDKSLDLEELLNSIKYGHEIENRTDDGIPE